MREALKPAERFATRPEPVVAPVTDLFPSNVPMGESETIPDVDDASVVSLGSIWHGSLKIEGSVKIEGQVTGEVDAKKMVFVAEGAQVDAKVRAETVVIAGDLRGEVHCSERLEVKPAGRVNATIATKSLEVHEGASISGEIRMTHMSEHRAQPMTPSANGKADTTLVEAPPKPVKISTD